MQLEGKVALVTGGASGIGKATAARLAADGVALFVVDVDATGAAEVASSIGGVAHVADVGDPEQVDAAFARCVEELGGVDIAFLNAGIAIGISDLTTLDEPTYRRIMRVNLDGVVYGVRAAIDVMRARGGGAIVATASLAGIIPFPPDPVYDATKHAVVGLIRSVAPTLAPLGITANCVNPGMTDTNIMGDDARKVYAELDFPLMEPSQIADAVVVAVTSGATGQCYVCQPGREHTPYRFHDVPGPRTESARGRVPPGVRDG
jgi:NAD(P)-dependent dehydrogenase (short-subunit alcohol dehydrogenase family)